MAFRRSTVRSRSAPPSCLTKWESGRIDRPTVRSRSAPPFILFVSMPYFVYVLKSEITDTSYVGHTASLEKRLVEHNNGKTLSTRGKRPWRLVYKEEFTPRSRAARRERYFKSVEGRLELKTKGIL